MLTTTANSTFLPIINPIVQGDISLQKTISDPILTLESILNTKLEQADLSSFETITNVNTKLSAKIEQSDLTPYVLSRHPILHLTENEMVGEEAHLLEFVKIYKNKLTGNNGGNQFETDYSLTNLKAELDLRYNLNTTHTAAINKVTQSQVNNENPILKLPDLTKIMTLNYKEAGADKTTD